MKKVLLKDVKGNELKVYPNEIINIIENKDKTTVILHEIEVIVISNKKILENAISNCNLP